MIKRNIKWNYKVPSVKPVPKPESYIVYDYRKDLIDIDCFSFWVNSVGDYLVTYTNPRTKYSYDRLITERSIIDRVKNKQKPYKKDMRMLREIISKHPDGSRRQGWKGR